MISRRQQLILVAAVVPSFSGCQSSLFSNHRTPIGPTLEAIGVGNWHSEQHTVHFQVRRNDELVLEKTVELDSYSEQSDTDEVMFRDALPDEPGRYEISAKSDGDVERTVKITDEKVCRVDIIFQKSGKLGISSRRDCVNQ